MGIKTEAAAYSSIGGRKNNEDNFYLDGVYMQREQMNAGGRATCESTKRLQVYGVFDGMGGGEFGELASFCGASRLKKYQEESEHVDNSKNLSQFLTETSKAIDKISVERGFRSGAGGSTTAMLIIGDCWYRTAHVGDSRMYLLRNGELTQLTKDQSEVQRLVDEGRITKEEAWSHPRKNVITHHLGMPLYGGTLKSVIGDRKPLQVGDCFLICSDGVSDDMRDSEIADVFNAGLSAEENASRIVRQSKKCADSRGVESDNVTAVVVKVLQVADQDAARRRVRRMSVMQKLMAACSALLAAGAVGSLVRLIQIMR